MKAGDSRGVSVAANGMFCIDPGVHTGLALWQDGKLVLCETMRAVEAESKILAMLGGDVGQRADWLVLCEDARLRTWFGKAGREALQGAGSIKRDCHRWEEWLTHHLVPHKMTHPKNSLTKIDAAKFAKLTGWTGRTSQHARDAACIGLGVDARQFTF